MTAQQARIGGKFLSLDRSQSTERAIPEEAQERRTTHPATAPLVEFLDRKSMGAVFMIRALIERRRQWDALDSVRVH